MTAVVITSYKHQLKALSKFDCLVFDYLPYPKLLPGVKAVIHHGGIGTIAQALAAGTPQLMVPFAHDQPDNVSRVEKLGAGLKLTPAGFNVRRVTEKLQTLVNSASVIEKCAEYSQLINFSNSMDGLIEKIENFYETSPKPLIESGQKVY